MMPGDAQQRPAASGPTGVWEKNTPLLQASALQSSGRNYYPAPDLELSQGSSSPGECFFHRHW